MKTLRSMMLMSALLFAGFCYSVSLTKNEMESDLQSVEAPDWLVIEGLVENPLNLTYAELWGFPVLSEVTLLECIWTGQGGGPMVTYNWTGIPLFYLLSVAKVIPGAYREVVFNATDGFSSSIRLETAMHPTTILALMANGTDLTQRSGFGSGYRVVLPCRWGYKWVKWVNRITVVDYDYKGSYEHTGYYDDEAFRPNCTSPLTDPPIETFNVTNPANYIVQALSNSSIESFSFESVPRLVFNVTVTEEARGYFYVTFPEDLMSGPYGVRVDQGPVEYAETSYDGNVYLYFAYTKGAHTIEVEGASSGSFEGGRHQMSLHE